MEIEIGDVVLCTVRKIEGTTVFVDVARDGEGSVIFSEVAPGRIRNIRDYAVPNKKIVCKVLRIQGDRVDLSLRRVTQKEQKEVLESYKQERSYISILKSIVGEKTKQIIQEIEKEMSVFDFIEESKESPEELEKLIGKENTEKVLEIVKTEKSKKTIVKKEINMKTNKSNGIELIKKILGALKGLEVIYISSGRYSFRIESDNPKKADHEIKETIEELEKEAKKQGFDFSVKEKGVAK